METESISSHLK
uniref:Uncharacterized protein n=1 Tax=Anguilla anguilla TaxID=7936 RepID=A0A0E9V4R8_ANGAN